MELLSWVPSFLQSLVLSRSLGLLSLLFWPGSWALVSPLCLTLFATVPTPGVKQQEDREEKEPMGVCHTLFSDWKGMFCSLRVLSTLDSCCHCWFHRMESETLRREKEKEKNENSLSLNVKNSLSHSWSRTTWHLWELSAQACGYQRKSGNHIADLVVHLILVCFPNLPTTVYFSESSSFCTIHSLWVS